ncbi:Uncharacterised protein [Yersinia enterocolitica]|nr:hypothetical protein CH47_2487 [Yersinia enterocolitica]VTP90364.1 Uncharacterised protein [Yersinia enterocolitica subsp. enterocolitica]AJJ25282.1 hypothetical protein CH49_2558 [Yersinia enterocolitica]KGA73276.1 hypothetical protein DJ59_4116 [Yersinia enterocolitica]KGA79652.1 hypothetical protein DJ60_3778 [Yersinia enterocolitica]
MAYFLLHNLLFCEHERIVLLLDYQNSAGTHQSALSKDSLIYCN